MKTKLTLLLASAAFSLMASAAMAASSQPPVAPAGASGNVQTNNGAGGFGALATSGSGAVCLASGCAINLTNGFNLPIGGVTGWGSGVAAALAINVGSVGAPVLNGGAAGTPSSINLTNGSNLPIGGVTGLGSGVASALAQTINASGGVLTYNGLGSGVAAALAAGVNGTGGLLTYGGAAGTPSAINLTNATNVPVNQATGALPLANGGLGVAGTLSASGGNVLPQFATNPITANLIAEYPMTEGSGTVVHDISGNGNTANFASGSNAPAWTTWSVAFGSPTTQTSSAVWTWVTTPLKTWKSVVLYVCPGLGPQTTGTSTGGSPNALYPALLGANSVTDGVLLINSISSSNEYTGSINPTIYTSQTGTFRTTTAGPLYAPCGTVAATLDTSDHIYWTPQGGTTAEIGYGSQGASSSYVTTASSYVFGSAGGSPANSGNTFKGYIAYAAFYSAVLTPAQVAQVSAFEAYQVQNRVGFPQPTRTNSQTAQAVFTGDSLTASLYSSAQWTAQTYLSLNNTYNIVNYGVGGQMAHSIPAIETLRACSAISPTAGHNVAHMWFGTNDVSQGGWTAAQTWQAIQAEARTLRACGFDRVIGATMISRVSNDTNKDALNPLIRANWRSVLDALDDLAAIPGLGADGAYANPTYTCFYSDQIHLKGMSTGTACYNGTDGYGAVAWNAGRVINILDGATIDNPTITTSSAYTQAVADVVVKHTPTAAATETLIDATGLTGSTRTIINASPTYSITVSGTGASGSTIVGNTTISPNTTAVFVDQLISATAGGNEWVRVE